MPRLSLHRSDGDGSLSLAVGLLLVAGGVAGGGFLLIDAVGGTKGTQALHAQRTYDRNETGLPVPTAEARQEVPDLVEVLEAAASTGEATLEDPAAVDRAVAYLNGKANEDRSGGSLTLPGDGKVLWEQFVIDLTLRSR